jgi:hypothetical protein
VAVANLAVSGLSVPMYIFGRRLGRKIARSAFSSEVIGGGGGLEDDVADAGGVLSCGGG